MNRTERDRPLGVVLWNFGCCDSAILAERLSRQLAEERYGGLWVEMNEMNKPYFDGGEAWYADFRATAESGVYMIAILSPAMNRAASKEGKVRGKGLLSELLWFWHKADGNRDFRSEQLIPILLDCTADNLKRPSGEYEQLQDIVVPLIKDHKPLHVTSAQLYCNSQAMRDLADIIARRMGIESQE